MGPVVATCMMKNKVAEAPAGGVDEEEMELDEMDPNELPFNPATDPFLEDSNQIMMSKCKFKFTSEFFHENRLSMLILIIIKIDVDLSHFDQVRLIGAGTHSFIWLVKKRKRNSAAYLQGKDYKSPIEPFPD